jgi:DNA-binding IscR family transcriptional regulator
MSIAVITKVWAYPHLRDQSQLLVMLALADYSNDDGESFPRVDTLADKARISERHVQKILSHLQTHGLLAIEKGAGKGKKPWLRTNLYRINIAKLAACEAIPAPVYKQSEKTRYNDTPLTGGIMTPLEVAYEAVSSRDDTPGIMPPKPSVREPSKKETKTTNSEARLSPKRKVRRASRETSSSLPLSFDGEGEVTKEKVQPTVIEPSPELDLAMSHALVVTSKQEPVPLVPPRTSHATLDDSDIDAQDKLAEEFNFTLNSTLGKKFLSYLGKKGIEYVLEKAEIARYPDYNANPRKSFFAAMREDWPPQPKAKTTPRPASGIGWVATDYAVPETPDPAVQQRGAECLATWLAEQGHARAAADQLALRGK